MKKTEIMNKASKMYYSTKLTLKRHAPEIMVISGVIGTVASAVMACKATLKANDILEETKEQVNKVHECLTDHSEEYSEEDSKKDLAIIYTQTALKFVKNYAPSVILGSLSIASIMASNNIMRKRNVALAAAYATVDSSFKNYRKRVVDRFGKTVDYELRNNVEKKVIEEPVVNKKGKPTGKTKKTEIDVVNDNGVSEYSRFFAPGNVYFDSDPEYNKMFLKQREQYANDMLKTRKYLFLNEVYRALGLDETIAGQSVGWVYDPDNSDYDNYIDFGMSVVNRKTIKNGVEDYEPTILLDFNVDGPILDRVKLENI